MTILLPADVQGLTAILAYDSSPALSTGAISARNYATAFDGIPAVAHHDDQHCRIAVAKCAACPE